MQPRILIQTERLLLRPAQQSDLAAIHAILSDPIATRFWSTPPHASLAQTSHWLAGMVSIPAGAGEDFVIEHEGAVIGKAGLYRFPEIGFILHPEYWGRGFAGEALAPVIERAFDVHRLAVVLADVDPRNEASLKVLRRLGFRESGRASRTWLVGDAWCDSVYLSRANPKSGEA